MKTVIRLLAICLFGAVIFAILAPYVSFRLRQREGTNALRGEPIYNGRPLHEWAEETQDQNIDFSPSPNALQAAAALRAVGSDAIPWLVKWIKPTWILHCPEARSNHSKFWDHKRSQLFLNWQKS